MARRVSGTGDRFDARQRFGAGIEQRDLVLDPLQAVLRADYKGLTGFRHGIEGARRAPEIPLDPVHPTADVREHRFVEIVEHAPKMIRVGVGKADVGDLGRVDSGRRQTGRQLADSALEQRPGAGIEQHHPTVNAQQGKIAIRLNSVDRQIVWRHQRRDFSLGSVRQYERHRLDQMAIAQDRDLGVADDSFGGGRGSSRDSGECG
jgi:hypothetical protein